MRVRLAVAGTVVVGAVAWLAASGLGQNLTYFLTPSELLAKGTGAVGARLRVGGEVEPGSVRRDAATGTVAFRLSDGEESVPVVNRGDPPELFREGIGAVVEGVYGRDGILRSDQVLIRHSAEYRPPKPGETPRSGDLGRTVERSEAER